MFSFHFIRHFLFLHPFVSRYIRRYQKHENTFFLILLKEGNLYQTLNIFSSIFYLLWAMAKGFLFILYIKRRWGSTKRKKYITMATSLSKLILKTLIVNFTLRQFSRQKKNYKLFHQKLLSISRVSDREKVI